MDEFKFFKTFKERGEWVEALFIAAAIRYGYKVLRPWGDSQPFDVALFFGNRIVRVQVKSTSCRTGTGYFCQFKPHYLKKQDYTLAQLDFFAAYVIPVATWYIIPAAVLLGAERKYAVMLHPMQPLKKDRYSYEAYKEAWPLLRPKSRRQPI
jgi:hypothetical protein